MDNLSVRKCCGAPSGRLRVMREGSSIIRRTGVPKPVAVVDTHERVPLPIFHNHTNWIGPTTPSATQPGHWNWNPTM